MEKDAGITDIEIESPGQFFLLIEAKRGWNLPGKAQLEKYACRKAFTANEKFPRKLIVLSECSREYARVHLAVKNIGSIEIAPISWKDVAMYQNQYRCGIQIARYCITCSSQRRGETAENIVVDILNKYRKQGEL